jgi:hypothetical protein
MILALMAGGSMFAASRYSVGVTVGTANPACAPGAYNSYTYVQPSYDTRFARPAFDRGWDRDGRHDRNDDRWRARNDHRAYSNDFRHR